MIWLTEAQVVGAFIEWERRRRVEPVIWGIGLESRRPPEEVGQVAADFFLSLTKEQGRGVSGHQHGR